MSVESIANVIPQLVVNECCRLFLGKLLTKKAQEGRKLHVALFWEGSKGWGLRTIDRIPKNAFVGEYVGEV